MYKLLFAVCVAAIAVVVAWMGLHPLEKTQLSLKLEEGKAYKVWIGADRKIEIPEQDDLPKSWDENRRIEFGVNRSAQDSSAAPSYTMGGSSMSGAMPFLPYRVVADNPDDTLAARQHYLELLPTVAAEKLSSMLVPLYLSGGLSPLKLAATMVVQPFEEDEISGNERKLPTRRTRIWIPFIHDKDLQNRMNEDAILSFTKIYPNKPVATGSSWQVATDSLEGFAVHEVTKVEVGEKKDGKVMLNLNSESGTGGSPIHLDTCGV